MFENCNLGVKLEYPFFILFSYSVVDDVCSLSSADYVDFKLIFSNNYNIYGI